MSEDHEDKEFAPSARRLERAREEGDAIRSEELQAAVAFGGFALCLAVFGPMVLAGFAAMARRFLAEPEALSLATAATMPPGLRLVALGLLVLLAPALAVLLWLIVTRGIGFAPAKLALKWNRLSPLGNARQKFGPTGLVDFGRRALKMAAMTIALALFLQWMAGDLYLGPRQSAGQVLILMLARLMDFLWLVVGIGLVLGLADLLWQWRAFQQRNRMSRKEMTDELRDSEGDPHQKADRRRRAQEVATRKMLVEVPKADVVIVNPTHYAVALTWARKSGRAPVCVAKGVDETAARIRALALAAKVPIHSDPPTARLLFAALEPGQEIRREHYAAVAAAIRFADGIRRKAGRRSGR